TGGRPDRNVMDLIAADRDIPRWIKATSWRNHRLMQLKNEEPGEYLLDLPWILRREALSLAYFSTTDPRRLKAVAHLAAGARRAIRKRQSTRPAI
ncbi:MAG TPA: hypothetical protein VEX62_07055, partial [Candidatus Limnocylindrales bacterium]|nr:hypothetical protein [Candidatus Limnocylindrales bacterium]